MVDHDNKFGAFASERYEAALNCFPMNKGSGIGDRVDAKLAVKERRLVAFTDGNSIAEHSSAHAQADGYGQCQDPGISLWKFGHRR